MQRDQVSAEVIANLCNFCDLDPQVVQAELEQFRCSSLQDIVPVYDSISDIGNVHELKLDDVENGGESDDEGNAHLSKGKWIESSYTKSLCLILQLSSYLTLTILL
jgi:hypothetical protein